MDEMRAVDAVGFIVVWMLCLVERSKVGGAWERFKSVEIYDLQGC